MKMTSLKLLCVAAVGICLIMFAVAPAAGATLTVTAKAQMVQPSVAMPATALAQSAELPTAKALVGSQSDYDNFMTYYGAAGSYWNSFLFSGSLLDKADALYYYAYAGFYYFMSFGDSANATSWFYYYLYDSDGVKSDYYYDMAISCYNSYQSSRSNYDLGSAYYYYAYSEYYYYLSVRDSAHANYYFNLYMNDANYLYNL